MIIKEYAPAGPLKKLAHFILHPRRVFFTGLVIITLIFAAVISLNSRIVLMPGGSFFAEPTAVTLKSTSLLPAEIRYTTDGTDPVADSSLYSGSFEIKETTALRAAAFRNGTQVSRIYTFPVFIGIKHELPVISIVANPDDLFDEETGIYHNYLNVGDEWEQPANLTFYEPDGTLGFQKDVGIRLHGAGSKMHPQKSFRIYAGYQDHSDQINYPIFPDLDYTTFNTFILRAGGGDWEYAMMRDAVMHELVSQTTEVDTQAVRPAVLYINNQYWGIYNLRERIDQHYLANKYGLSRDRLSIIEIPHDVGENRGQVRLDYGNKQAVEDYNRLFDSAKHCKGCTPYNDFSLDLDIRNYTDYMMMEFYSGNFDWPFGNVKLWRYEQPRRANDDEQSVIDGRLRWIFYDTDVGMGFGRKEEEDMIDAVYTDIYGRMIDERFPFRNLFYDSKFRQEYLTRMAEQLNTAVTPESVTAIIDNLANQMRPEIPRQAERWKGQLSDKYEVGTFASLEEWEHNVELLRVFARHRSQALFEKTAEYFEISGLSRITLESQPAEGGAVSIGAIHKEGTELPWEGTFFNESYMAVEAHPQPGYVFEYWQNDIPETKMYNQRVVIKIEDQEKITAVFRKKHWYEYLNPMGWL